MLKHYFKIAIRNLWKYRFFTLVNVSGLAVGMSGALLLLLWIADQFSFDKFHENGKSIYKLYSNQVINQDIFTAPSVSEPLTDLIKNKTPEVKQITRLIEVVKTIKYADKSIQSAGFYSDPSFLTMFTFPLIDGDKNSGLKNQGSILITEKLGKILFGSEKPIGKIIQTEDKERFIIEGILKDPPSNTQLNFDFILPIQQLASTNDFSSWKNRVTAFVEIQPDASPDLIGNKITALSSTYNTENDKASIFLYPLYKLWLRPQFQNGKSFGGIMDTVRFLLIIAFLIIFIACVNYINLNTARSGQRAREVGVRKVLGVSRNSLIWQFICESILTTFITGIIAIVIVIFLLPSFNNLTEKNIHIQYQSLFFWLSFLGFILFIAVLSGSYPAFFLSSFRPVNVLKGVFQTKYRFISLQKVLVVLQFTFAVILINFTILLKKQIAHMEGRETGFRKENLIFFPESQEMGKNFSILKNELIGSGQALFVNRSNVPITGNGPVVNNLEWPAKSQNDKVDFELRSTDQDFVKTNGAILLDGRDIDIITFPSDTLACLINETALKIMGLKSPIGQIIRQENSKLEIVGVIKDFLTGSPMQDVTPVIVRGSDKTQYLNIRLKEGGASLIGQHKLKNIIKKYNAGYLTEVQYADYDFALKMKGIKLSAKLCYIFSSIVLFISCLGLFGLVIYAIGKKAKEISIRKVFGSSVLRITYLINKEFVKLVLISILIASPIAWILMNSFLRSIYYKVDLGVWTLLESALLALSITILTITWHSLKAATRTPIKNLRDE